MNRGGDNDSDEGFPRRGRLPHGVPCWVPDGARFLITINCQPRGTNQLVIPAIGSAVLDAAAFNHQRCLWECRLMLLMPDHLHAILAFGRDGDMKTVVANWKRFLANSQGMFWQRDFFDHRLRDHHEEMAKTSYILNNPFRAGLVNRPEDWRWVYRPTYQESK